MQLKRLRLRNFRTYEDLEVTFGPGLNQIVGNNGLGKSNLLEAIYLVITGRSFRTANLAQMVREGASGFFIEALFEKSGVEQTIRIGVEGKERKIALNQTRLPSLSALLGHLRGVLLAPEDRDLVSGAPAVRRRLLDLHLAQLDPNYTYQLARYHQALKQRNSLLRSETLEGIELWETQMCDAAPHLTGARHELTLSLQGYLNEVHKELTLDQEEMELTYRSSLCTPENLESHREKDLIRGGTSIGPQRDDLQIILSGKRARAFGSEGQKSCCAIALKLAEWQRLKELSGETPLMLIDDAGASLDERRKEALHDQLQKLGQAFLSAPTPLQDEGHIYQITCDNGRSTLEPPNSRHPARPLVAAGLH